MSEEQGSTVNPKPIPRKIRRLLASGNLFLPNPTEQIRTPPKQPEALSKVVLTAILTAVLTTIASQIIIEVLSLNEPNLVYIGNRPAQPSLDAKFGDRQHGELDTLDISISQPFRNWGLTRGHVEKVVITPGGVKELMPNSISEPECDRTAILAFRSREVKCRFIVTVDINKDYQNDFTFWSIFYGPGGHEIYRQGYTIERSKYGFRDRKP